MNMNELRIDDNPLCIYGWCGDDPLPIYGGGMTERELAVMRELDPNFDQGDNTDDGDFDFAARGYKTEYEVIAMRFLFPKPSEQVPIDKYPYKYESKPSDMYWLPEDEKSGIKDKVQALIRRARDEVGDSIAALLQFLAQHASDFGKS